MSRFLWLLIFVTCFLAANLSEAQKTTSKEGKSSQSQENAKSSDPAKDVPPSNKAPLPPHLEEQLKQQMREVPEAKGPALAQPDSKPAEAQKPQSVQKDSEEELPEFPDIIEEYDIPVERVHQVVKTRISRNEVHTSVVFKPDDHGTVSSWTIHG
jgi:hypothetical protein